MKRALSEAFARYGMSVSVLHGGETAETKAFLQLVKRENGEEPFSVTALGAVDEQCWRYLGPADVAVAMGDFVQCGERRYVVRAAGCEKAAEAVTQALMTALPEGLKLGSLQWGKTGWDKTAGMFRLDASAKYAAYFVAEAAEDETVFTDFVLKGTVKERE